MTDNPTPLEAIKWLTQRGRRTKVGDDVHTLIANVIRQLVAERAALNGQINKLEKEIAKLTAPKPISPAKAAGVDGSGEWGAVC